MSNTNSVSSAWTQEELVRVLERMRFVETRTNTSRGVDVILVIDMTPDETNRFRELFDNA